MKGSFPPHQAECGEQSVKAKYMVTVKMADKDMINPSEPYPRSAKLQLSTLTAINQKKPLMCIQHMSGWISF
jgi:hypothetical protein